MPTALSGFKLKNPIEADFSRDIILGNGRIPPGGSYGLIIRIPIDIFRDTGDTSGEALEPGESVVYVVGVRVGGGVGGFSSEAFGIKVTVTNPLVGGDTDSGSGDGGDLLEVELDRTVYFWGNATGQGGGGF